MKKEGIPFDGFGSVIEMLRRADGPFRDKILQNIRRRDPDLAYRLESNLRSVLARDARDQAEDSRDILQRSQRAANTRNYGL